LAWSLRTFSSWLFAPRDNAPLVVFRIFFGALLFLEAAGAIATGWVYRVFVEPRFTFPIMGFQWLEALPGKGMYAYFALMAVAAVLVTVGFHFRAGLTVFTVLWSGSYVMQTTAYNNHYYLIILLCLLLLPTPAHADLSWDAEHNPTLRSRTCPRWCSLVFIAQAAIVYFYATIAKLYPDWLAAKPLAIWLSQRTDYPIIGGLYAQPWLKWVLAYGGILFDGLIIPLLLWQRTRLIALGMAILFHLFNSITFQIGIFPYLAMSLCIFFFPPERVRDTFSWLMRKGVAAPADSSPAQHRGLLLAFLSIFFLVQIALPLRHFLYPGNVHWTEEGHRMAWHMMLRTKSGRIHYVVKDPVSGKSWRVNPSAHLGAKQSDRIATRPDMIWQFAQRLARQYRDKGYPTVEVYAFTRVSLNGRPYQPLVNSEVDLAKAKWTWFQPLDWLVPLEE
jgi:hypothetical protein